MAVLPATEETNGFFAVGVSVNYDGVIGRCIWRLSGFWPTAAWW